MLILIDYILILDSDVVNKTMSLSEEYLKILKSKQKRKQTITYLGACFLPCSCYWLQ